VMVMAEEKNKRPAKVRRLLKDIARHRFTFAESRADLELLRSIHQGTYADTKPGDPSFHAYAAALNTANEFATQAMDFPELTPFNNQLVDIQEEYQPSYPPLSPVTSAFFTGWMVLDARDSFTKMTLGDLFVYYLSQVNKFDYVQKAMTGLNDSFCSFYEVLEVDIQGLMLWDLAGKQEVRCWCSSGYSGGKGEIWYVRVVPPLVEGSNRSVTMGTPYVFRDSSHHRWEDFFQRYLASGNGGDRSLRAYLKHGKSLGYWLEFVFQAFTGYTGNMILATGVPDDPASLPHYDPGHKL
jgi:hypothetical protein